MNLASIKYKLVAAFLLMGCAFFLFVIAVVPNRTKATAGKVMEDNVEFTVKLLSDNLAIGMQTRELDNGAALQQTLDLLKGDVIASVAVLDPQRTFIKGMNTDRTILHSDSVLNTADQLRIFRTMRDSDGRVQGYVEVAFSKRFFIESIDRFMLFIWITGGVTLLVVVILGGILANRIIHPLNRSIRMLQELASGEGDLTRRLALTSKDEVGKQAYWINMFIEKLQAMVAEIKQDADELHTVSEQLQGSSDQTSTLARSMKSKAETSAVSMQQVSNALDGVTLASRETSQAVRQIADAMEGMNATVRHVAANCLQESAVARKADEMASAARERIKTLEEMAQQIGKIVKLIQAIADRTNLLSLNAAIQAASAGEAGRGFAVVANEIKELARQTTLATDEINMQIEHIQKTVTESVEQIGGIAAIIGDVNAISQTILTSIEEQAATTSEIANTVTVTSSNADTMMSICDGNAAAISNICVNISEVKSSAEKTENGVQQSRESILDMTAAVDKMHMLVDRFKI
jgi:methyl-accepting chemotaxis protein